MLWKSKFKLSRGAVAGVLLALAAGSPALGLPTGAGVNLLNDPGFNGQPSTFQSSLGPYAAGWTYTPDPFHLFGGDLDWVSQTLPTTDLYYYNITFTLGTQPGEPGVDFSLIWDVSLIDLRTLPADPGSTQYSYTVTANGTSSDIKLVGNSAFWSSLYNLNVDWTGAIDPPPVPDSPIGFGLEAALLLGLCGAAGLYHRQDLRLAPTQK